MAIRETRTSRRARLSRRYGFEGYQTGGPDLGGLAGSDYQEQPPSSSGEGDEAPQSSDAQTAADVGASSAVPEGQTELDPALAAALAGSQAATGSQAYAPGDEFDALFAGAAADPATQVYSGPVTRQIEPRRNVQSALTDAAASIENALHAAGLDDDQQRLLTQPIRSAAVRFGDQAQVNEDSTAQAGDVYQEIYDLGPAEMSRIQRVLFAGGFYGGAGLDDISFGEPDELTWQAWTTAVTRAARKFRGGDGERVTVEDVMREAVLASRVETDEEGNAIGSGADAAADAREDRIYEVNLTDPESIRQTAREIARGTVQRDATPEEQRMIVAALNSTERQSQIATQDRAYDLEEAALMVASDRTPGGGIPVYVDSRGRVIGLAGTDQDTPGQRTPSATMGERYQKAERRVDVLFPGDPGYDQWSAKAGGGADVGMGQGVQEITNTSVDTQAQIQAWYERNRPVDVNEATGVSTLMDTRDFLTGGGRG